MIEHDLQTVLHRIDRLESRLSRRRTLILYLAVAGGISALVIGASTPGDDTIRARRFILVDEQGKERAFLGFKEKAAGLYFNGDKSDAEPLITIEARVDRFTGSNDETIPLDHSHISVRSRVPFKRSSYLRADGLTVVNLEDDESVSIGYWKQPLLEFKDKSGFGYVLLTRNDREGASLRIGMPLGIKGAMEEVGKSTIEGKPTDPRIEEAFQKSHRIRLVAPPFSDPSIDLFKDGRLVWTAPR